MVFTSSMTSEIGWKSVAWVYARLRVAAGWTIVLFQIDTTPYLTKAADAGVGDLARLPGTRRTCA